MRKLDRKGSVLGAALLLVTFSFSLTANAQDSTAESRRQASSVLEEVIVTARRREERLQDTPIAVTALSAADLKDRGIVNIQELTKSVPSLQISEGHSNMIYIRGVGERTGFVRVDPTVGVYLDDLFIPRTDGQLLDTVDVESIQVLRGPQGTLFGKNTTGGALVLTLAKPHSDGVEGYIEGGIGSFRQRSMRAAVNVPITDRFSIRGAVNFIDDDGFLKDISGPRSHSMGRQSLVLQTRWDTTDDLRLDTLAFYGRIRERFPGFNCNVANPDALLARGIFVMWSGDTDPSNPTAYIENCERNSRQRLGDLRTDMGPTNNNLDHDLETFMLGATTQWHYHTEHSIKLVASFRDEVRGPILTGDQDGGPAAFNEAHQPEDSGRRSMSLELQFNGSAFNSRLDYTAGLFAMRETNDEIFLLSTGLAGFDALTVSQLAAQERPTQPPPGGTVPLVGTLASPRLESEFDLTNNTLAAFLQASYNFTERLQLTLGIRHTEEQRRSNLHTIDVDIAAIGARIAEHPLFQPQVGEGSQFFNPFLGSWAMDPVRIAQDMFPDENGDGIRNYPMDRNNPLRDRRNETFSETTPMATLSYNLPENLLRRLAVDDAMVYATYSEGFKSGFFEPRQVDGLQRVEPETLINRELGLKIDAFDRRVRFNMAVYSMRFTNMQLIQVETDSANNLVVIFQNAGRSEIDGGELELTWLPFAGAALNLSYSHNRYQFTEFDDLDLFSRAILQQNVVLDRTDEPFPVSPETTLAAGFQFAWQTDFGVFIPRIDVSYKSDIYMGLDPGAFEVFKRDKNLAGQEAFTLVDLRLSWRNPAGNFTAALYAKNALDKRYFIGASAQGDSTANFGQIYGDPRRIGVDLRYEFE